jgi:hypothetical protein
MRTSESSMGTETSIGEAGPRVFTKEPAAPVTARAMNDGGFYRVSQTTARKQHFVARGFAHDFSFT